MVNSPDVCLKNVFAFPVFSKDVLTGFTILDSQPLELVSLYFLAFTVATEKANVLHLLFL